MTTYYTGFFLCLGFLRLFGQGLIFLTADDCIALGSAPGATARLERGVYSLSIEIGVRTKVSLKKKKIGGFHEGFWRFADDSLKTLAEEISRGSGPSKPFSPRMRAAAILSVEDLRIWLGAPGKVDRDVGWMSSLRNEINYRLLRNVWTPNYRDRGVTVDRLSQDVRAMIRGSRDRLGAQLQLDRDIRAMTERVCVLFRDLSPLSDFPRFS